MGENWGWGGGRDGGGFYKAEFTKRREADYKSMPGMPGMTLEGQLIRSAKTQDILAQQSHHYNPPASDPDRKLQSDTEAPRGKISLGYFYREGKGAR